MPPELAEARTVLRLCERFHCLPSQLLAEDVALLRYLAVDYLAQGEASKPEPQGYEQMVEMSRYLG